MITLKWKYEPLDFLIKRDRDAEALKFLPQIYNIPTRKNVDKSDKEAVNAYYQGFIDKRRVELVAAEAEASKVTFKEAVFGTDYYRATWMSACLNIGNQFSAIGPVCIYSSTILDEIMKETNGEFPITIREGVLIIGTVTMLSAFLGVFPAKFMGRVLILTSSHMALAITHAIIAILYYVRSYVAMYAFMQIFIFWFYVGTGNVSFIYAGEACVDQAMGVVLGVRWMTEMVMSFTISLMIASPMGVVWTFVVYSVLNLVAFTFMCFLKETRGKTPQQLKELYISKKANKIADKAIVEMAASASVDSNAQ